MYNAYAGDKKHRPLPKIAAAFNVEPSVAREALIAPGRLRRLPHDQGSEGIQDHARSWKRTCSRQSPPRIGRIAELEARNAELEAQIDGYTAPAGTMHRSRRWRWPARAFCAWAESWMGILESARF